MTKVFSGKQPLNYTLFCKIKGLSTQNSSAHLLETYSALVFAMSVECIHDRLLIKITELMHCFSLLYIQKVFICVNIMIIDYETKTSLLYVTSNTVHSDYIRNGFTRM